MTLTNYLMFTVVAILGIALIFIIYMMATKGKSTKKLLIGWMFVCLALLIYSLFTGFISNPPECVEQFKAVVSTCREFVFKL